VLKGDTAGALDRMEALYQGGADPLSLIQELLDLTHFVTRLKLERGNDAAATAAPVADGFDRKRGLDLAGRLGMAALGRSWQLLLKGLAEVQAAPQPLKAAEMALIRLIHVADLPPPAEILKLLQDGKAIPAGPGSPAPGPGGPGPRAELRPVAGGAATALAVEAPAPEALPQNFAEVMALVQAHREGILYDQLASGLHLVRYAPGTIEFRPEPDAPRDLAGRLGQFLQGATGTRWIIGVASEGGEPTWREQETARRRREFEEIAAHPMVRAVLAAFPGARIVGHDEEIPPEPPPAEEPMPYEEDDPGPFAAGAWDGEQDLGDEP